ncbi:MAG: M1 family metallopeptidase [Salibacteraceae bacterium]|nr:M1 family metallopeptidase [Salibacteraceae bacterium]MDP4762947.1 M1 family metallopeptidase [Salibacteraceae bacterium]MDP4844461.1 M1 family metallopeptidase [Salibacteraceae bacterium]MDP4935731.1 M1 family metallopeptidase [Salibacteraceae bacterium]MDP4965509.1 M1 family metallopeptidase [Salibacteraceae bacterium]
MKKAFLVLAFAIASVTSFSQTDFAQLGTQLPTPNVYRTASGAPGHEYYQQQANYKIDIVLDDAKQRIDGKETVTYINNSPDQLSYLWLQLDQNMRAQDSDTKKIKTMSLDDGASKRELDELHNDFDGGFKLMKISGVDGTNLPYTVVKTMMRIDLPKPIKKGESFSFNVEWWYNINNRMEIGGRSGYEHFEKEDNYLYTIAQFFPRMCVYNEVEGWQNKQFLGSGEFTLPFGDYEVNITVPSDHIVGATGTLENADEVLTQTQRDRFEEAKTAKKPVMIVNQKEAEKTEKAKAKGTKTWKFKAENVRDYAFASSRKFIWDAMGVDINGKTVMCMGYYPKEGNPLWEQYNTEVVAHTIKTYSKYTIDYEYPVAISVHTNQIGMEYPMICFNGGRPEEDGTYSERTKYGMISVIIHEVGHNFFPMIINSDERQWTWMDEGLNTFIQYLTEVEWDPNYPSRRGNPQKIVDYMKGDQSNIAPIMTNSESIFQFGNNAYGKPATALNILRETILGRELFDFAFKTYCERWAYKHPTPADFFRTMEDASGVDLDWFWRGWFFNTDPVDISLDEVQLFHLDTKDPKQELAFDKMVEDSQPPYLGDQRNAEIITKPVIEQKPELKDFYNKWDRYSPTAYDVKKYQEYLAKAEDDEKAMLAKGGYYYQMKFTNQGGLPMPIILQFTYEDGSKEKHYIPAEIWRFDSEQVSKVFYTKKKINEVILDPESETADVDKSDNYWPQRMIPSKFEMYKSRYSRYGSDSGKNPMQKAKE